jgi:hypothetical protein
LRKENISDAVVMPKVSCNIRACGESGQRCAEGRGKEKFKKQRENVTVGQRKGRDW